MKNSLCNEIFNFDVHNIKNVYLSKNEIYNQFLLYMFFNLDADLLLVYSTLNEATEVYNDLRNYVDNIYIFPEDDFMTKNAIAMSPELLYLRLKLLNNIKSKERKIVLVHYNSFVKKVPNKSLYEEKKIIFNINDSLNLDKIFKKLLEN